MNIKDFTPKQRKSFDRSVDRAIARNGGDDVKVSLYIRISESRLYNGKHIHKAMLKELAFLRTQGLHEADIRIPQGTPWSNDYRKYEGWVWASQKYLANRIGASREQANRVLRDLSNDELVRTRKYRGRDGSWHKQYFLDETAINARITELGPSESEESAVKSDDKFDGTLVTDDHQPLCATITSPSDPRSPRLVINSHSPSDPRSQQEGLGFVFEVGVEGRCVSTPPQASPSGTVTASIPHSLQAQTASLAEERFSEEFGEY
jgi:hypothetical protein